MDTAPSTLTRRFAVRMYDARTGTETTAIIYAHTCHGAIEHRRVTVEVWTESRGVPRVAGRPAVRGV